MRICTVRLDQEAEESLEDIRRLTGLPVSEVLRRGVHALRAEVTRSPAQTAFEIYAQLDLGPGGYALAPSTESRGAIKDAIRRKHRR